MTKQVYKIYKKVNVDDVYMLVPDETGGSISIGGLSVIIDETMDINFGIEKCFGNFRPLTEEEKKEVEMLLK